MKLDIRRQQISKSMGILLAIRRAFPETGTLLREVSRDAKNGITVEVYPLVTDQTNRQRRYYHMWKNAFAEHCGNTPDEMHEHILCETYGSVVEETRIGMMRRPVKRSSSASRIEYSRLIDTLIRVAADLDFVVPPPINKRETM